MAIASTSQVKDISPIERELSIVVTADGIKKELDKAYQKLSQKVSLKGFRQGKVPRNILEQYYQPQVERDVLESALDMSFKQALIEHNLIPVSDPSIEPEGQFIPGVDFSYRAKVEIKPTVKLQKWEGLAIEAPQYTIGEDDVKGVLENLRARQATVVPETERQTIMQGDLVECQISAVAQGTHLKDLSGLNRVIEIGSGQYPAQIEQALVGKTIGEKVNVSADLPESYPQEDLRGQQAEFAIVPKQIKVKQLPAIDDEFAKDVSEQFTSLDELTAYIRADLATQKESREKSEKEEAVLTALIEKNDVETPKGLVRKRAEDIAMKAVSRLDEKQAKMIWQKIGERLTQDAEPKAIRDVKANLILEAVALKANLPVSDQDVEEELEREAKQFGITKAKMRSYYKAGDMENIRYRLRLQKALEAITNAAHVTTVNKAWHA